MQESQGIPRRTLLRLASSIGAAMSLGASISCSARSTPSPDRDFDLQETDGGADYYSKFKFGLPTAEEFFPLGVWSSWINTSEEVALDHSAGINIYVGLSTGSSLSLLNLHDKRAILSREWLGTPFVDDVDERVCGWILGDEIDMIYNGAGGDQEPGLRQISDYAESVNSDGRMKFANFGKGVAFYGSEESSRQYLVDYADSVSLDLYWFSDQDLRLQYQGGRFLNGSQSSITDAEARRGSNYGLTVKRARDLIGASEARPVWNFVELGETFGSGESITPEGVESAVWHSIIAGARGIVYFNSSFGKQPNYNLVRTVPAVRENLARINAKIQSLAPQINARTATDFCVASKNVSILTKYYAESFWIFVSPLTQGAQYFSISLSERAREPYRRAEIHGSNVTLPIDNGVLRGEFDTHDAVQIYRVFDDGKT